MFRGHFVQTALVFKEVAGNTRLLVLGICQKLSGGRGVGILNLGLETEVTHRCNGSEIC